MFVPIGSKHLLNVFIQLRSVILKFLIVLIVIKISRFKRRYCSRKNIKIEVERPF